MRKAKLPLALAAGGLLLAGCVTQTNKPMVNTDSAYDKRVELGMNYLSVGNRDQARWQFNKALDFKKDGAEAYHGLALVHQANGELQPAGKTFQKAMRLAEKDELSPIALSYAGYLTETGERKKACEFYEKAAADYDFNRRAEALYQAALCARDIGNVARVKPALEHAINLNPNYSVALLDLAEVYYSEGRYPAAKQLFDRFTAANKPTAQSLWLGIRLERVFGNADKEASYALALKNLHPYSKEYLEYQNSRR